MTMGTDRLRVAIDRLEQAARADFIQADSMLGAWAATQIDVLNALYIVEEGREEQLRELIGAAKATADAEAARSQAEVSKADRFIIAAELKLAQAQSDSVTTIGDGIAARVQGALVIRAKAYNRGKLLGTASLFAGVLLVTLLAGYGWSSHDHANTIEGQMWEQCRVTAVIDKQGRVTCTPTLPPERQ